MPIFLTGLCAFLLGWLWLVVAAFRSDRLWGWVCLLFPPLLLLFVPMRWHHSQFGFYVAFSGLLLAVASLYAGADVPLQRWLQQPTIKTLISSSGWDGRIHLPFEPYSSTPLSNAAEAEAIRAEQRHSALPPTPSKSVQAGKRKVMKRFQVADMNHLKRYVGDTVRVFDAFGGEVQGVLSEVGMPGIVVKARMAGGSISYHLAWPRISQVEIYASVGTVQPPEAGRFADTRRSAVTLAPSVSTVPLPLPPHHSATLSIAPPAAAARAPAGAVDSPRSTTTP